MVLLAGQGGGEGRELFREEIAERVGRSRQFVDQWAGRYRTGGLDAVAAKKQPGRAPKLTAAQDERLKAILDGGPRPADKVCTLRMRDVRRIVEAEFGVVYTAGGIYDVLRRLDYSSLKPRPRHRKNDPAKAAAFGRTLRQCSPLSPGPVVSAQPPQRVQRRTPRQCSRPDPHPGAAGAPLVSVGD